MEGGSVTEITIESPCEPFLELFVSQLLLSKSSSIQTTDTQANKEQHGKLMPDREHELGTMSKDHE